MAQFTGNEGNPNIPLEDARQMVKNYSGDLDPTEVKAYFYGKNHLMTLLNQQDCMGLRIYFAKEEDETMSLMIVGADANGDDLINGHILDLGNPCPNECPSPGKSLSE